MGKWRKIWEEYGKHIGKHGKSMGKVIMGRYIGTTTKLSGRYGERPPNKKGKWCWTF